MPGLGIGFMAPASFVTQYSGSVSGSVLSYVRHPKAPVRLVKPTYKKTSGAVTPGLQPTACFCPPPPTTRLGCHPEPRRTPRG